MNSTVKMLPIAIAGLLLSAPLYSAPVEWTSYNRTLASERFAPLDAINRKSVTMLKVICSYDTQVMTGFQTGLLEVDGALYGTTEHDTFSINPDTCQQNWRAHENGASGLLKVNRGVAYLDGKLFRGTPDGHVIAYDAHSGRQLWSTAIADPRRGESVPSAPIAWQGMVFVGTAGSETKGVKGRMYALEAANGNILWEFYLVPKAATDVARGPEGRAGSSDIAASWRDESGLPITGGGTWTSYTLDASKGELYIPVGNPGPDFINSVRQGDNLYTDSIVVLDAKSGDFRRYYQLVKADFHDWDASTAPILFTTKTGKALLAEAPKDGHLYAYELSSGRRLYRQPVTRVENTQAPLTAAPTRFCPGTQGGAEWNGAAYDPTQGTVLTGEVDWCTTLHADAIEGLHAAPLGGIWTGSKSGFGKQDDVSLWAGWLTATDAETGMRRWRFKAPFPLMSGITPTAGGLVLFGDMGGTFYALDARNGKALWSQNLGGAVAGGVITYDSGAGQKIAVAAGMTSPIWPTQKVTARVVVLGLQ